MTTELKTVLEDVIKAHKADNLDETLSALSKKYGIDANFYQKIDENLNGNYNKIANKGMGGLVKTLMESANIVNNVHAIGKFTEYINKVLVDISKANYEILFNSLTKEGTINQNPQYHGFLFEDLHTQLFNIKAQQANKSFYAMVERPLDGMFKPNSVDITIRDKATDKILHKYGAKCCKSATDTLAAIRDGDYRGQRLLVPAEQVTAVKGALSPERTVTSTLSYDGVEGRPISYDEAQKYKLDLQSGVHEILTKENIDRIALFKEQLSTLGRFYFVSSSVRFLGQLSTYAFNKTLPSSDEFINDTLNTLRKSGVDLKIPTLLSLLDIAASLTDKLSAFKDLSPINKYFVAKLGVETIQGIGNCVSGNSSIADASEKLLRASLIAAIDCGGVHLGTVCATCLGAPPVVNTIVGGGIGGAIAHKYSPSVADKVIDFAKKLELTENINSLVSHITPTSVSLTPTTIELAVAKG